MVRPSGGQPGKSWRIIFPAKSAGDTETLFPAMMNQFPADLSIEQYGTLFPLNGQKMGLQQ